MTLAVLPLALILTGCSNDGSVSARPETATQDSEPSAGVEAPVESAPTVGPAPTVAAQTPKFTDPAEMMTVATAAGFQCLDDDPEPAQFNVYGALAESCFHGSANETVYFEIYPTPESQEASVGGQLPTRQGEGWGVSAITPATADELFRILDSAPVR